MIIFDEKEYAEDILAHRIKGNFVKQRDLNILAKYYAYLGLKKYEVREKLIEYATSIDEEFNEIISDHNLDFALRNFGKNKLRVGEPITIYADEIDKIHLLDNINEQKVIFVMLVISKVFNKVDGSDYYYNGLLSDVFKLARLNNLPKEERIKILHQLTQHGAIEPNLKGGYKIAIATKDFVGNINNIAVSDFYNMIDMFPTICPICHKVMLGIPKRREYCDSCYNEKRKKDIKENVKKNRSKSKKSM